jgi:PDZ domain-containing protein
VRSKRRGRVWAWSIGLVLVGLGLGAAFLVPTPFYLFEPGTVRATQPNISIEGHEAYTTPGEINYPTVGIRQATVAGLMQGWLDDAIEIQEREEVYPSGDVEEDRVINRRMMDRSKFVATVVAFTELGYPVAEVGAGAFVDEVLGTSSEAAVGSNFPAAESLEQGDIITAVDGRDVVIWADLRALLSDHAPGDEVTLTIQRGDAEIEEIVTLGTHEEDPGRGYLGVTGSTAEQSLDLPFDLEIDSGRVTGPSAGLAWTLGLIDRLTPGDLADGRDVAVTGTMSVDGSVGPIGGLEQKMAAITRGGYDMFIYPASSSEAEIAQIEAMAGDVELHAVSTLSEAIDVLAPQGLPEAPPLS